MNAGSGKPSVAMVFHKSFQPYQGHYLRTFNQARSLVRSGFDVRIFAWDRECRYAREEVRDGIRIRRFHIRAADFQGPKNFFRVLRFNLAVLRALATCRADLFVCYSLDAVVPVLLVAKLRRRKAVLDLCEPNYYAFWGRKHARWVAAIQRLERFMAKRYDHVTVHNLYQVRKFRGAGIRHVTQLGSYPNRSMLPDRPREGLGETVTIGRLGTIYRDNGLEEFLEAFRRLLAGEAAAGVTYRFLLAGRVLPAYEETLKRLVAPFGDRVELSGAFTPEDLPALYRRIDLSCVLYRRDSEWFRHITPTKLFESLAAGVPVLASDMGDVKQIVEAGDCGLVVDETDPEAICGAIERMTRNPDTYRRMASNALRLAREKYTWEVYEPVFVSLYETLTGRAEDGAQSTGK